LVLYRALCIASQAKGLVFSRAYLLSEFDVQKNGFGLRLSAAPYTTFI